LSTGSLARGQFVDVSTSVARLALGPPGPPGAGADVSPRGRDATGPIVLPSFDELYEQHFDFVWRTARRLGVPAAAADDVVQDTFLVLHRKRDAYDGATPVRRWLSGILARVVADHRRRWRRKESACVPHPEESERQLPSSTPPPNVEMEQCEAVALLDRLLAELDDDKREVLVLVQLEEMTVPEVAEHLGANVNTIYARLRAARRDFDLAHARHRARMQSLERRLP